MTRRQTFSAILTATALAAGCGSSSKRTSPTSPSATSPGPSMTVSGDPAAFGGGTPSNFSSIGHVGVQSVPFPPQNEPVDFLNQLETHYRSQLGKAATQTFVDVVGHAVWMQDYLRYRLNQCSHADAVSKTLLRVDTQGNVDPPECGTASTGQLPFPPQNESLDFLTQLEHKYQTRGGRATTYVDATGHAAWMADYLRYRVNRCGHFDAIDKVFTIVDTTVAGRTVIPPDCVPPGNAGGGGGTGGGGGGGGALTVRIAVTGSSCEVNAPNNTLSGCTIKATTSAKVDTYKWMLKVKTNYTPPNSPNLTEIGCNFPDVGGSYPETITVQVIGPSGTATSGSAKVTIKKGSKAC